MRRIAVLLCLAFVLLCPGSVGRRTLAATGNVVSDWNAIAVTTVTGPGAVANQGEAFVYMAYVAAAVYDAVVAIEGGYEPYGPALENVPDGASVDAAVVEAAYKTLWNYFPGKATELAASRDNSLAAIPNGQAKTDGQAVGLAAANQIITMRAGDGRQTPYGTTSSFSPKTPAPGVWRLTPTAYAAAQTPWLGNMMPFVLDAPDHFHPEPPPSLKSGKWVDAFNEVKAYGDLHSTVRTEEETAVARFWTANTIRQYNLAGREIIEQDGLTLLDSARLLAAINLIAADASMTWVNAKYQILFWRPVTAIDPTSVQPVSAQFPLGDGLGPIPGFDDGNPATEEQAGWRPLLPTPNHPEYPSAHGTVTSAMAEVFRVFLGTNRFNLTLHGFAATGLPGNLDAVRVFATPDDLRDEVVNARVWGGLHYRFSVLAGVSLGKQVAQYDLAKAFRPVR